MRLPLRLHPVLIPLFLVCRICSRSVNAQTKRRSCDRLLFASSAAVRFIDSALSAQTFSRKRPRPEKVQYQLLWLLYDAFQSHVKNLPQTLAANVKVASNVPKSQTYDAVSPSLQDAYIVHPVQTAQSDLVAVILCSSLHWHTIFDQ
jgi:hypothetical protein